MLRLSAMACALTLAAATLAEAQVVEETTTTATPAGPGIVRYSQLMGSTVRLNGANEFGKVQDIVWNPAGGAPFLVVANGNRTAMLPWSAGNFNAGQRIMTYNVAPAAIQPLYFEGNQFPNIADPAYTTRVTRVFPNAVVGPVPAGAAVPAGGVERVKIKERPNGTEKIKVRERP